jgi:hypothetical protein
MCSFWKWALRAMWRWNRFLQTGHMKGRGLLLLLLLLELFFSFFTCNIQK